MPYFFEQLHVLLLKVVFGLLLLEFVGCWFGFAESVGDEFDFVLVVLDERLFLFLDGGEGFPMFLILLLLIFLEELVLSDGAGAQDDDLH